VSLGIDPISRKEKLCTFDCSYCQVGETQILTDERKTFLPTKELIDEIKSLPPVKIDYITFSGRGEPTLAKNLGEMIREIRNFRKEKIAVITNASLIDRKDVQEDLALADLVMAKLDACSEESFTKINRPLKGITLEKTIKGIKDFRSIYKGRLELQIMFVEENKACAKDLAKLVEDISPDEVQINTPLRPSAVKPLSKQELDGIIGYFKNVHTSYVYEAERKMVEPISKEDTSRRRRLGIDD